MTVQVKRLVVFSEEGSCLICIDSSDVSKLSSRFWPCAPSVNHLGHHFFIVRADRLSKFVKMQFRRLA